MEPTDDMIYSVSGFTRDKDGNEIISNTLIFIFFGGKRYMMTEKELEQYERKED